MIKINVDTALNPSSFVIVVVARDWRGELVFVCSKKVYTNLSLQAEAEAVKCAIKLSANLDFVAIFNENDSKVVVEALSKPEHEIPWRILNTGLYMSYLLSQYPSIHVSWVPRTSNGAAHSLVKWSLDHIMFLDFLI